MIWATVSWICYYLEPEASLIDLLLLLSARLLGFPKTRGWGVAYMKDSKFLLRRKLGIFMMPWISHG